MSKPASTRSRRPEQHRDAGCTLVAWVLLFMALGTFTPCVLLPQWRTYQALRTAQQVEQHRLDAMQKVVDRERRFLEALQTNPAVIARLAQRELGFKQPGDRSVRVSVPVQTNPSAQSFTPEPILPPPILARAKSYLPDYNYDALFCDDQTRLVFMAMSVALMGVAIWLPGTWGPGKSQKVQKSEF